MNIAQEQGTRALDQLRLGVENAIQILGQGFLSHPNNKILIEKLRSGTLSPQEYYRQLLRLIYRLIFLFVTEDRNLLLKPDILRETRWRYDQYYSMKRLRELVRRHRGTRHVDAYHSLRIVMMGLRSNTGLPTVGLSPLNSFLWSDETIPDIENCLINNQFLFEAIRKLVFITQKDVLLPIDFKNLGTEELGSVYESLLELHPIIDIDTGTFELKTAAGHERKTTGSYYTPASLITSLLDSALEPVLKEAISKPDSEKAILALKVCDPAAGSGHFLIAAAHRIAKKLALIRTGEIEPSPEEFRKALRDVIGHCIYAVDINPMAAELCKVALWLEAMEPGKPLTFLEHHIQVGNSLLGTNPALIKEGIPDTAFKPIDCDNNEIVKGLLKLNRMAHKGQTSIEQWNMENSQNNLVEISSLIIRLDKMADNSVKDIHNKTIAYQRLLESVEYKRELLLADSWCAAFFWKKDGNSKYALTEDIFRLIKQSPNKVPNEIYKEIKSIKDQFQFFHWYLAFPDIFIKSSLSEETENKNTGLSGGFDVIIGNPPWERIKLQEKEYLSSRSSETSDTYDSISRENVIKSDAAVYKDFILLRGKKLREKHFLSESGVYPLCGSGDLTTYALFPELFINILNQKGQAGFITQTQLITEKSYSRLTKYLLESQQIISCYAFENERLIFPSAHHSTRFILLSIGKKCYKFPCAMGLWDIEWLTDIRRIYELTKEDIIRFNPITNSIPQFRTKNDAKIAISIYNEFSPLKNKTIFRSPISVSRVMHDKDDREAFIWGVDSIQQKDTLPILESKVIEQYNHRYASYKDVKTIDIKKGYPRILMDEDLKNPEISSIPRKWVRLQDTPKRFFNYPYRWILHVRNITNNIAIRTVIAAITPKYPNTGSCQWIRNDNYSVDDYLYLLAMLNSIPFDYLARQKVGGIHLNSYHLYQIPLPDFPSEQYNSFHTILCRHAFELSYTSNDLMAFANDCDYYNEHKQVYPPFEWNSKRRHLLKCEINAISAILYNLNQQNFEWVLDPEYPGETFRVLKETENKDFNQYQTKTDSLSYFIEIQKAISEQHIYTSRIPKIRDDEILYRIFNKNNIEKRRKEKKIHSIDGNWDSS